MNHENVNGRREKEPTSTSHRRGAASFNNALDAEPPIASFLKSMLIGGGPVNANVRRKTMRRSIFIFLALGVGWIVYMIAMVMTVYDGLLSMIFQPIIAVICSSLAVGISLLVGLIFKIPVLGRLWRATPIPAALLVMGSLVILCFGSSIGLSHTFTHPETQQSIEGLRPDAAVGSYFALLFAIANWPVRPKGNAEPGASHEPPPRASDSDASGSSDAGFAASDRLRRRSVR